MMRSNSLSFACECLLILLTLMGCDQVPPLAIQTHDQPPQNVVSGRIRKLTIKSSLASQQPLLPETILKHLDFGLMRENLIRYETLQNKPPQEWKGDLDRKEFARFLPDDKSAVELAALSDAQTGNAVVCCFNAEGSRFWSVGQRVMEWDFETWTPRKVFDYSPVLPKSAFFDSSNQTLIVGDGHKLIRMSADDGAIIKTWDSNHGEVVRVVPSHNFKILAVVCNRDQQLWLHAIDSDFQTVASLERPLANVNLDIDDEGTRIACNDGTGSFVWKPGSTSGMPYLARFSSRQSLAVMGKLFCSFIDSTACTVVQLNPTYIREGIQRNFDTAKIILPYVHQAKHASDSLNNEWITALTQRWDQDGKVQWYFQDLCVDMERDTCHSKWPVPFQKFDWVAHDASCRRIALRVEDHIRVWDRPVSINDSLRSFFLAVTDTIADGNFSGIEELVHFVIEKHAVRFQQNRNELLTNFTQIFADAFHSAPNDPSFALRRKESFEAWFRTRSPLALLCSAQIKIHQLTQLKVADVKLLSTIGSECEESLNNAMHDPRCSTAAKWIRWKFGNSFSYLSTDVDDPSKYVMQCVAEDPYLNGPLVELLSLRVVPRPEDYIRPIQEGIAKLLPTDLAQKWYGKSSLAIANKYSNVMLQITTTRRPIIDENAALEAAVKLAATKELTQLEANMALTIAILAKREDLTAQLSKYILRNFNAIGRQSFSPENVVEGEILKAKQELISDAMASN